MLRSGDLCGERGGECGVLRIYAANGGRMRRSRDICGERGKYAAFRWVALLKGKNIRRR